VTALRVPCTELAEGPRDLPAEASRYVARVHRKTVGDTLVLVDGATELEADARIVALEDGRVHVLLGPPRPSRQVARRAIVLVQALAKGDKLDAIVRDATELGVTRIVPVETARTVVKLGARGHERVERWRRIAREAARQSLRGDEPVIDPPTELDAALALAADVKIVLAPTAAQPLGALLRRSGSLALLVGPEGGLDPDELARAAAHGWEGASFGPFVLRTETVAAAVLGAIAILGDEGR
jgi:16S rRNA (uracil1498-N3)-methyltransferase